MESWNLNTIETPDGTRDPVVLSTHPEARAVLIRLDAGQRLGPHQVKERTWLCVVDGRVAIETGAESVEGPAGTLVTFAPDERHAVRSESGARILLLLAPWPGEGHYRGGGSARS